MFHKLKIDDSRGATVSSGSDGRRVITSPWDGSGDHPESVSVPAPAESVLPVPDVGPDTAPKPESSNASPAALPATESTAKASLRRKAILAGVIALLLIVVASGTWLIVNSQRSFQSVAAACANKLTEMPLLEASGIEKYYGRALDEAGFKKLIGDDAPQFIHVNEDGSGMSVSREPSGFEDFAESKGMNFDERADYRKIDETIGGVRDLMVLGSVGCIHQKLGIPEAVVNRMQSTRAMDGQQSGSYSGIKVSWSYHPSTGMQVFYEHS